MRKFLAILSLGYLIVSNPVIAADEPKATQAAPRSLTAVELQANDYAGWLQQQMKKMDALLEKVRQSQNPQERQTLMQQYAMALQITNTLSSTVQPYLGGVAAPASAHKMGGMMRAKKEGKKMGGCMMMQGGQSASGSGNDHSAHGSATESAAVAATDDDGDEEAKASTEDAPSEHEGHH